MLSPENQSRHNECVRKINAMSDSELLAQLKSGSCPYEPEHLIGIPLGQFHCEVCGMMIVAGLTHPPIKWVGDTYEEGWADFVEPPPPCT